MDYSLPGSSIYGIFQADASLSHQGSPIQRKQVSSSKPGPIQDRGSASAAPSPHRTTGEVLPRSLWQETGGPSWVCDPGQGKDLPSGEERRQRGPPRGAPGPGRRPAWKRCPGGGTGRMENTEPLVSSSGPLPRPGCAR